MNTHLYVYANTLTEPHSPVKFSHYVCVFSSFYILHLCHVIVTHTHCVLSHSHYSASQDCKTLGWKFVVEQMISCRESLKQFQEFFIHLRSIIPLTCFLNIIPSSCFSARWRVL